MNTRNTASEVADYLIDKGIIALENGEEIVSASCDGNNNLLVKTSEGQSIKVSVEDIRKVLNVNVYWECDPYKGGEKFLIFPEY